MGDNCCIENIKNYIANYIIGDYAFIENVDIILVDVYKRQLQDITKICFLRKHSKVMMISG